MNVDFVGGDSSFFVAHRLDPGYREPSVAQVGQGALQGIVQIVLQRWSLFRRSQYPRIHAILLAMTVIDKLGRKTLLLIGSVGTAGCLAGVSGVFFTESHQSYLLWLLVAYIAFFAISQGAVIWVYISEVFPNRVRAKGQALGSSSHWIMNAIIAYTFPQLAKSSGAYPFVLFSAMMVVQFFVVLFFYPETKGVTLEQMQHRLGIE